MPSVAPLQSRFDGGEISPLVYGRVDVERYKTALALCKNWLPLLQGDLMRRPGTQYLGAVKNSANKTRFVKFIYSTTQAYVLEFGDGYVRFWANYAQIQIVGTPLEVATPYVEADLFDLKFVQSADVLYIVHPKYAPAKLVRYSATNWILSSISFNDGPYNSVNSTVVTMTPSAASGAITVGIGPGSTITNVTHITGGFQITTSAAHGLAPGIPIYIEGVVGTVANAINNRPSGPGTQPNFWSVANVVSATQFQIAAPGSGAYSSGGAVHPVGSKVLATNPTPGNIFCNDLYTDLSNLEGVPIRVENAGKWGWGIVSSYANPYTLNVTVDGSHPYNYTGTGSDTSISWATGFWASYASTSGIIPSNYPSTATFHEDRLCFGGAPFQPNRIDGSKSSDYENMAPTALADGSVANNNAVSFSLNAQDVNAVQWLSSDEKGLLGGALAAEWIVRPAISTDALSPTNISAKRSAKFGCGAISPVQSGRSTIYAQRGLRKIRELLYAFDIDGFRSTDLTEIAEHITGTGITDLAAQTLPISNVWCVRNDGALLGLTYDRDMNNLRVGWHWHVLGGKSDAAGSPPVVESIAVIPSPDGTRDDLWMVIKRYVNGATVRYVEVLTKISEDIDDQNLLFFVDCGLTYNAPLAITGISNANPAAVTCVGHGLSTGNEVQIDSVVGLLSSDASVVNGLRFTITVTDADHFTLNGLDTSAAGAYVSGGVARKTVTTISGLTHLENETVAVLADGLNEYSLTVSNSGQITLPSAAAVATIGYAYASDAKLLRFEAGSRNGTSMGKTRRIHRVGLMVHRTQALKMGRDFSNLDQVSFPDGSSIFSGIVSTETELPYDFDNQLCIRADKALPALIQAVMPMMQTQDRA